MIQECLLHHLTCHTALHGEGGGLGPGVEGLGAGLRGILAYDLCVVVCYLVIKR